MKEVDRIKQRVDEIKKYLTENGSTKGLVIKGLEIDSNFSIFLKNYADEFSDVKFVKRGER